MGSHQKNSPKVMQYLLNWSLFAVLSTSSAIAENRVANIDFFGHKGIDVAKVLKSLPLRQGDEVHQKTENDLKKSVTQSLGKAPTDIAVVCCDKNHDFYIFIGLPGLSSRNMIFHPEPQGESRLPPEIISLAKQMNKAVHEAVRKGNAEEDFSNGYSLSKDPSARALQLAFRQSAIRHEQQLIKVVQTASSTEHRQIASQAIGYLNQSHAQIAALVDASKDINETVRNNAIRALGVLVNSKSPLATEIPADNFIDLLNSGSWTDRNKGLMLLTGLTAGRSPDLLKKLQLKALDALVEMASWRQGEYALGSLMILGRIADIPEKRLVELCRDGSVDAIIKAATRN